MSKSIRNLDSLFEDYDAIEAETVRQRAAYDSLDSLLLSDPTPLDTDQETTE